MLEIENVGGTIWKMHKYVSLYFSLNQTYKNTSIIHSYSYV